MTNGVNSSRALNRLSEGEKILAEDRAGSPAGNTSWNHIHLIFL
jgi:hypothetical protein